ncbi:hypothetical protein H6F75_27525 [Nodosilinea sp. FACHB-131]|nr:hypothetical protein [Nodosilinea sp. FACHB-131]
MTVAEGKLRLATAVVIALVPVAWGTSTAVEQAARVARARGESSYQSLDMMELPTLRPRTLFHS